MSTNDQLFLHCGRAISGRDIEHLKEVVGNCSGLARRELAETLCEHWDWVTASGTPKLTACLNLLEKLDALGIIRLNESTRTYSPKLTRAIPWTSQTDAPPIVACSLEHIRPITLAVLGKHAAEKTLWAEYMDRYHPLGFKQAFGCRLQYWIQTEEQRPLGCLQIAGAAKAIGVRDAWIGWTPTQRLRHLPWVINNTRFLLFPWIKVPHLASHVLGQLTRRLRSDWNAHFGYQPTLIETFVDPAHYSGTSYKAAGWMVLGQTKGRGLLRPGRTYQTTPKLIFVYPLVRQFRRQLLNDF